MARDYWDNIAEAAEQLRRQVAGDGRNHAGPELYQGLSMLAYHLRQATNQAAAIATALRQRAPRCDKIIRPGQPWRCSLAPNHSGECTSESNYSGPAAQL
jgi:hypothetical protein